VINAFGFALETGCDKKKLRKKIAITDSGAKILEN
jgi:hypothetical protein